MKLKCNVCLESPTLELPKPTEGDTSYCPVCDKVLAHAYEDIPGKPFWSVVDNEFDESHGFIPVEIIEL